MNLKHIPHLRTPTIFLIIVSLFILFLAGCVASPPPKTSTTSAKAKIKIVAAENFYGELAMTIGGNRVAVTSIITNPAADPHDFEPTLKTSKLVYDAQIVLYNGIGFDEWIKTILNSSSNSKNKIILAVGSDILGKKAGDNPHIWYDPSTMTKLADQLANKLAQLDPSQASAYKQRATQYIASLAPIKELIQTIHRDVSENVAASEPVYDYMLEVLNYKSIDPKFSKAIEEEMDPSPSDVANLQTAIKLRKIRFFIQNIQSNSPTVTNIVNLAKANKIPIIQVTETKPSGVNYLQWMLDPLNQMKASLSN